LRLTICGHLKSVTRSGENAPTCVNHLLGFARKDAHRATNKKGRENPAFFVHQDDLRSFVSHFNWFRRFRTVNQFNEGHRRVVTDTETTLQNTKVAARTG